MKYSYTTFRYYVGTARRLRFQVIGRFYPLDARVVGATHAGITVEDAKGRKFHLNYSAKQKFGIFSVDEM